VIERCRAYDRVIVVSEHDAIVAAARRQRPGWCYGAPMGEVRGIVVAARLRLAWLARTRADIFMIPETHEGRQVLDDRLLNVLHRRGKKVWIWVVNQPADVGRLRRLGVDGIFTEYPQRILQASASA
jgi:glycerophosphoryl diester phosphodiesterase